ncbi:MAG: cobalamin-dependent protein [Anaerolineaceae bacterium]|nr:cobalamin-dependent protein [Anaerolineaceae bacterium]
MEKEKYLEALKAAVVDGEEDDSAEAAQAALDAGLDPLILVNEAIQKPLEKVGKDFENGDVYLPELILVGDAARSASDVIMPHISAEDLEGSLQGKAVIGVVSGDLHDIGKNIVAAFLAAQGLKVIDLGTDVAPKTFVETVVRENAQYLVISTLLSTSRPFYRQIISLLEARGKRGETFILVGGGPVTPKWANEIGADGYGRDAKDAVNLCRMMADLAQKPPLAEPILVNALT